LYNSGVVLLDNEHWGDPWRNDQVGVGRRAQVDGTVLAITKPATIAALAAMPLHPPTQRDRSHACDGDRVPI
jgi:hypothetical protein